MRADQAGASGSFGAVPLLAGTFMITAIALVVAVPVGLMSAIYLSEYASSRLRRLLKPMLELLAGIPTVVYGYFAVMTVDHFNIGLAIDDTRIETAPAYPEARHSGRPLEETR